MNGRSRIVFVFDFFGVICSEVAPFWLEKYFSRQEALELKTSLVSLADSGNISQDELFSRLGRLTHQAPDEVAGQWNELALIDAAVVAIVEDLRASYRVALLTNAPSQFVRSILRHHDLERLFEVIVVSSEIRISKPDRRAYLRVLELLSVPPQNSMMIDDNRTNIEGAIAAGMFGHHFVGPAELGNAIRMPRGDA